jgi:rhodanese-related sulfurtransferase
MKKALSALSLIAALLALSACATMDSSNGKSKYKMVDVTTAKALHERNAKFIDVRSKNWFDEGHIPGAVNIPFSNFNGNRLAKIVSKDQEVVFYCYGINCEKSNTASNRAFTWGYQKVYYFMKGYPAWLGAGYPIEQ